MASKRVGRMPKKTVELVQERSQGMCEALCGRPAENIHHRRFLGRGGKHNIGNLLALCGQGNTSGCHGMAHGTGDPAPDGWAISSWDERMEEMVPFTDLYGVAWWLTADGKRKQVEQ